MSICREHRYRIVNIFAAQHALARRTGAHLGAYKARTACAKLAVRYRHGGARRPRRSRRFHAYCCTSAATTLLQQTHTAFSGTRPASVAPARTNTIAARCRRHAARRVENDAYLLRAARCTYTLAHAENGAATISDHGYADHIGKLALPYAAYLAVRMDAWFVWTMAYR